MTRTGTSPICIGFRNHRGKQHGRVLVEHILDLDRGDVSPPEMMMSLERSFDDDYKPCSSTTPRSPV